MYSDSLREDVSQGDIFADIVFARVDQSGEEQMITAVRGPGMLISHDCQYDKPTVHFVLVARVRPLSYWNPGSHGNIRKRRAYALFYLEAHPPGLDESAVDLETLVPVRKSELARLSEGGSRIASISEEARRALREQVWLFFSREPEPPPGA